MQNISITNLVAQDEIISGLINEIDQMNMRELGKQIDDTSKIHVRVIKRNRRKCVTIIENLPDKFDLKKILKEMKQRFTCGGTSKLTDDNNKILKLTGDQRELVKEFLINEEIMEKDRIIIHGY